MQSVLKQSSDMQVGPTVVQLVSALPVNIHAQLTRIGFFGVFVEYYGGLFYKRRMPDFTCTYYVIYNGQWNVFKFSWLGQERTLSIDTLITYGMTTIGNLFDDRYA
jgi:hypothetical protein